MRVAALWALGHEARALERTVRDELAAESPGPVLVSGVLAEQLVRELAAGAEPGAVGVGEPRPGIAAAVRIVAGEPSEEDEALVREADRLGVPVVVVQLWPQPDRGEPFVLSPFVVECRTGEGFPIDEIAGRLVEAVEGAAGLAARVPALGESLDRSAVRGAVARSAWLGLTASSADAVRPLLTLEQARLLARLRTASTGDPTADPRQLLAGALVAVIASGFALRALAREARRVVPPPVADAVVAAGGTFFLARVLRLLEQRSS